MRAHNEHGGRIERNDPYKPKWDSHGGGGGMQMPLPEGFDMYQRSSDMPHENPSQGRYP